MTLKERIEIIRRNLNLQRIETIEYFKRKPKKLFAILLIAAFVGFYLWGLKADAAELGLGLGKGYANNAGATYQEIMVRDAQRHWYASVARIGGDNEFNYKYWRGCGGYQVNWRKEKRFAPYARLGACYFDEAPVGLVSERLTYELAFGVRFWGIVELDLDTHNSTAGRSDKNAGLDAMMLRVLWRF